MAQQRRCRRCSTVYDGDGYSCPYCRSQLSSSGSGSWSCAFCGGGGCRQCSGEPNPRIDGGPLSTCAGWIGAFVVAILLAPVIMKLTHGNPLEGLFDWLGSLKAPGSH